MPHDLRMSAPVVRDTNCEQDCLYHAAGVGKVTPCAIEGRDMIRGRPNNPQTDRNIDCPSGG